ncbi:MAG: glycerophosphodiester phosphodiesterase [Pseudomonadales bacterium]
MADRRHSKRKRLLILIFLPLVIVVGLILLLGLGAPPPAAAPSSGYFSAPKPMVIAHQGGDGLRPSNTLVAFQHAVELGVDVLEMDLHQTRDGALVLMHDTTVDRTTDGSGALADLTLEQVRALDAGYRWPYEGTLRPYRGLGIGVPTLEEVVDRHRGLRFNIEIKPPSAAVAQALCDELLRLGITDQVLVASFHPRAMDAFRAACPGVPTSAYASEVRRFYVLYRLGLWRYAQPEIRVLQVPPEAAGFDLTDPGFLAAARRRGLHVDIWTVNDADHMRSLVDRGVAGIITDRPDLLLGVLDRPGSARALPR